MTDVTIQLGYGHQTLSVRIPSENLGEVISPQTVETIADPSSAIQKALSQPIGTSPLSDLVSPDQTVAIIVDDLTRSTPVTLILPLVLAQLQTTGVQRESIRIVLALGTHRAMTESEIVAKLGTQIATEYEIVNVPGSAEEAMIFMGTSSNGIPAWVNKAVAEANIKIGIGQITPHMDAGFSGGAKIILPGVCSTRTVEAFHGKEIELNTNLLGRLDSPIRQDLEQFVGDCVGLDFIVNVIMKPDHQFYRCVAGHFI
ncbi:MAG: lactate racemase domain-containing protein, partial [Chloroflexota bacterium]